MSEGNAIETVNMHCLEMNQQFETPLPDKEVQVIARSVARWVRKHYQGNSDKNRGIMDLNESLSIEMRQSLGAYYTNGNRRKDTLDKNCICIGN